MKQLVAQLVVAALLLGVGGFFVWLWRSRRAARAAGSTALQALAAELGTQVEPGPHPRLQGRFEGRACSLQQQRRVGSDDDAPYVHLEIECAARASFQLHRSRPALVSLDAADRVHLDDPEFDRQLELRSSDAVRARAALSPALRQRLLETFRHGGIDGIVWRDGRLRIDGGFGLREDSEVARARLLLQTGAQIAAALER